MSTSSRSARSARSSRSVSAASSRTVKTRPDNGEAPGPGKRAERRSGVSHDRKGNAVSLAGGARTIVLWVMNRRSPFLPTIVAALFLVGTLLGTLALRTWMVEDSFEATRLARSINNLKQDAQEYQNQLDRLEAQLPAKAQKLGMVPQQGSIAIDLNGYQPPADSPEQSSAQEQEVR